MTRAFNLLACVIGVQLATVVAFVGVCVYQQNLECGGGKLQEYSGYLLAQAMAIYTMEKNTE